MSLASGEVLSTIFPVFPAGLDVNCKSEHSGTSSSAVRTIFSLIFAHSCDPCRIGSLTWLDHNLWYFYHGSNGLRSRSITLYRTADYEFESLRTDTLLLLGLLLVLISLIRHARRFICILEERTGGTPHRYPYLFRCCSSLAGGQSFSQFFF